MWNLALALIALVTGFVLVFQSAWTLPSIAARYMAIAVLAVIDSALGALRALSEGEYDRTFFLSGLLMNAAGAALLVLLGDQLGVDLYLAAVFAFGYRVFQNLGTLRRRLILHWRRGRKQSPAPQGMASSTTAAPADEREPVTSIPPSSAVDASAELPS